MPSRTLPHLLAACLALSASLSAYAQSGLRPKAAPEGLDPAFAGGWLAPEPYRLAHPASHWTEALGFAPSQRFNWAYQFGERASLGLAYRGTREFYYPAYGSENPYFTLFGRYWLAPDWSVSAEAGTPAGALRLNDLRIGVRRSF